MSRNAEFEKPPEFQNFKEQMSKLLKVFNKELDERMAEYAKNSKRKHAAKKTVRKVG